MKSKKPCLVSHADVSTYSDMFTSRVNVCNYSDMFMSQGDKCLVPRSSGPENKLTYHTHVLLTWRID